MNIVSKNGLLNIDLIIKEAELKESMKIADLGCGGHGFFVFPIARRVGKKGLVYAVDILKTMLENIRRLARQENLPNVKVVWSDLESFGATQIESEYLDRIFIINTLCQAEKRAEFLREAIRMLKKNGRLVIIEWKDVETPFGPKVGKKVDEEILKKGGEKLGLQLVKEVDAGQYNYCLIFEKA